MKKEEKRKVPELRFKGFTDDWKECELGNAVTRLKSYSLSRKFETNDVTNFKYIHYGDIHTGKASKITNNSSLPFIEDDNYDTLTTGDVILTDASEDFMGIALPAILQDNSDDYSYVAGLHTIAIRPQNNIYPNFLYYSFLTNRFRKFGNQVGTGMKVFGINYNNLSKFELLFSSNINEQKYISKIINSLSKIIDAEQDKLLLYKQIYTSLLQLIFVKSENEIPKIYFLNNHWVKYKVAEVANLFDKDRKPVKEKERIYGTTPYYGANGILSFIDGYTHNGEFTLIAEDGANNIYDYPSIYVNGKIWVNNHTHVLQGKNSILDTRFLSYRFKSMDISKYLVGSGRWKLNGGTLQSIPIYIPDYDEQIRISVFLNSLNQIINLEEEKINKYTNLKSYLLDKLFI